MDRVKTNERVSDSLESHSDDYIHADMHERGRFSLE
jgi:hypothetical protein